MKQRNVWLSIFITVSVFSMEMEEETLPGILGLIYPGQKKADHIIIHDQLLVNRAQPQSPERMHMDYNWNAVNNRPPSRLYTPYSCTCASYECMLFPERSCAQQSCSKGVGCIGCCFGGTLKIFDAGGEHYGNGTSCQEICRWDHLWFPTTPQEVYSGEECINAICWTSSISLIGCSLFALGATIWDCRRQ